MSNVSTVSTGRSHQSVQSKKKTFVPKIFIFSVDAPDLEGIFQRSLKECNSQAEARKALAEAFYHWYEDYVGEPDFTEEDVQRNARSLKGLQSWCSNWTRDDTIVRLSIVTVCKKRAVSAPSAPSTGSES